MTKSEFISAVADRAQFSRGLVKAILDGAADVAMEAMTHGQSINLPGIGKIDVLECEAEEVVCWQSGERVHIPAKREVTFKPAKALRDAVR